MQEDLQNLRVLEDKMLNSINEIDFKGIITQIKNHIHKNNNTSFDLKKEDFKQITKGNNNFVFIVLKEEIKLVLRISINENNLDNFLIQNKILSYFNEVDFIPCPKILYVAQFKAKNKKIYPFMVQELIKGKSLRFSEEAHSLYKDIATFLFRLHNHIPSEIYLKIEKELKKESWFDFLNKFIVERIYFLEKYGKYENTYLNNLKDQLILVLNRNFEIINNVKLSFLHGDVFPPNFLIDDNEKKILGVVDWDLMKIGDPAFEISSFESIYAKEYINIAKKTNPLFDEDSFRYRMKIYFPIIMVSILCSVIKHPIKNRFFIKQIEDEIEISLENLLN